MQGEWIKVGPTKQPYCEVVTDDSGMVYISVQSGAVRTSDYLTSEDAARVGQAISAAARRARNRPQRRDATEGGKYDNLGSLGSDQG
jgi:hypothetical protein